LKMKGVGSAFGLEAAPGMVAGRRHSRCRPMHEPASREGTWGEVGAFEGGSERLSGPWSAFEHGGSPFRPYRNRVLAAWNGAAPMAPPVVAFGVRVIVPVLAGTAPGVIALHPVAGLPVLVHGRL
jgi:hypothetical protein